MPFTAATSAKARSSAPPIEPPIRTARGVRSVHGAGLHLTRMDSGQSCPEGGSMLTGSCLCGAVKFDGRGRAQAARCLPLHAVPEDLRALLGVHRRAAQRRSRSTASSTSPGSVPRTRCSAGSARPAAPRCSGTRSRRTGSRSPWAPSKRPTGTKIEKHIFVADKGDYYEIKDGLPQNRAESAGSRQTDSTLWPSGSST